MMEKTKRAPLPDAISTANGRRFRFMAGDLTAGNIRRRFAQPRTAVVTEELIPASKLLSESSVDCLDVIVQIGSDGKLPEQLKQWLSSDTELDRPSMTVATVESGKIRLRGNRAVVYAASDRVEDLLTGLIEFTFLDGELRALCAALSPIQSEAPADVPFAFRILRSHRKHWDRLVKTMEKLAQLRLTFARLEPLMGDATPSLPLEARRVMSSLIDRTSTADRLEAFSDRLEACEDLYEGAVDRITDFQWYRRGNLLEIAIVVLLASEAILLAIQYFRR